MVLRFSTTLASDWRRTSVVGDLCLATVSGRGPDGYGDALKLLGEALEGKDR